MAAAISQNNPPPLVTCFCSFPPKKSYQIFFYSRRQIGRSLRVPFAPTLLRRPSRQLSAPNVEQIAPRSGDGTMTETRYATPVVCNRNLDEHHVSYPTRSIPLRAQTTSLPPPLPLPALSLPPTPSMQKERVQATVAAMVPAALPLVRVVLHLIICT